MQKTSVSVKQPVIIIYPQKVDGLRVLPGLYLGLKLPGLVDEWLVEEHRAGFEALTREYGEHLAFSSHDKAHLYGKLYLVALSPSAAYKAAQRLATIVRRCLAVETLLHRARDSNQMEKILISIN